MRSVNHEVETVVPEDFLSPISRNLMENPVIDPTGRSCERDELISWITVRGTSIFNRNLRLTPGNLVLNHALKCCIREYSYFSNGQLLEYYQKGSEKLIEELQIKISQLQEEIAHLNKISWYKCSQKFSEIQINWPFSAMCPLSLEFITEPVITPGGLTYQKSAITTWLERHNLDPYTAKPLAIKNLIPNLQLIDTLIIFKKELENDSTLRKNLKLIKEYLNCVRSLVVQLRKLKESRRFKLKLFKSAFLIASLSYLGLKVASFLQEYGTNQSTEVQSPQPDIEQQATIEVLTPLVTTGSYSVLLRGFKLSDRGNQALEHAAIECEYSWHCINLLEIILKNERVDLLKELWNFLPPHKSFDFVKDIIQSKDTRILYLLEKMDTNLLAKYPELLPVVASSGDVKAVEFLLNKGIPINSTQNEYPRYTAIQIAAEYGDLAMMEFLLERNASHHRPTPELTRESELPIQIAAKNNHCKIVTYLLKKFPSYIKTFATKDALFPLILNAQKEMLELLIKAGINPNLIVDMDKRNPIELLPYACYLACLDRTSSRANRVEIVQMLLDLKPEINDIFGLDIKDFWHDSNEDIVTILLKAGVRAHYSNLQTILHTAPKLVKVYVNEQPQASLQILSWEIMDAFIFRRVNPARIETMSILLKSAYTLENFDRLIDEISYSTVYWKFEGTDLNDNWVGFVATLINAGVRIPYFCMLNCPFTEDFLINVLTSVNKFEKIPDLSHSGDRREKGISSVFNLAIRRGYFNIIKQFIPSISVKSAMFKDLLALAKEKKKTQIYNFLRQHQLKMSGQLIKKQTLVKDSKIENKFNLFKNKRNEPIVCKNRFDVLSTNSLV